MDVICTKCGLINDYKTVKGGQDVLSAYCNGCEEFIIILPDNRPILIMPFGKHKGRKLEDLVEKDEIQYLNWLVSQNWIESRLENSIKKHLNYF